MVTDQTNSYVNAFVKGMNLDTSLDVVDQEQYVFGQNIRITNNTLLSALIDSNSTEGLITPVNAGVIYRWIYAPEFITISSLEYPIDTILAVVSLDDEGAVIVRDDYGYWHVVRVQFYPETSSFILTNVFDSSMKTKKDRFSVVINREIEGVTKIYIADGVHEMMQIDLDNPTYMLGEVGNKDFGYKLTEDELISNHLFPTQRMQITKQISGTLKTSQVQYTYRYYKKYGIASKLAPLTNKIQVIDPNRHKETGNAENTITSVGFALRIPKNDYFNRVFDHIQIFRLSYIKAGQNAEIQMIFDAELEKDMDAFTLSDTGVKPIQELSIDEFASLYGQDIVPQVLEQNQNYMFAANVEDRTLLRIEESEYDPKAYQCNSSGQYILYADGAYSDGKIFGSLNEVTAQDDYYINEYADLNLGELMRDQSKVCAYTADGGYYGGTGKNISWKFVITPVAIHENFDGTLDTPVINDTHHLVPQTESIHQTGAAYYIKSDRTLERTEYNSDMYLWDHDLYEMSALSYDNIFASSMFRSLHRDEVYRYGVVFYDKYGVRSDVLWIGDIRTPSVEEVPITTIADDIDSIPTWNLQVINPERKGNLYALPIGIQFEVKKPFIDGHEIVGYQIVRCEKTNNTSKNIVQVATSKPIRQNLYGFYQKDLWSPLYPTGLITTQNLVDVCVSGGYYYTYSDGFPYHGVPKVDQSLFQIFCPEIQLFRKDVESALSNVDLWYHSIGYQYGKSVSQISDDFAWRNISDYGICEVLLNAEPLFDFSIVTSEDTVSYSRDKLEREIEVLKSTYNDSYHSGQWHGAGIATKLKELEALLDIMTENGADSTGISQVDENAIALNRLGLAFYLSQKSGMHYTMHDYGYQTDVIYTGGRENIYKRKHQITNVSDVLSPTWEEAFSHIQFDGTSIIGGVKQYKSYVTSINNETYVNWVCQAMYDMRIGEESQLVVSNTHVTDIDSSDPQYSRSGDGDQAPRATTDEDHVWRSVLAFGWVGPGPLCLLIKLDEEGIPEVYNKSLITAITPSGLLRTRKHLGTIQANISHTAIQFAGLTKQEKQYDVYYGFGNFNSFKNSNDSTYTVYDGDTYIMPCEFTSMYKSYDFNSTKDSLQSNQIVYYIPLETKINTFFDYGLNYRNTSNPNLQLEPGKIEGITSQDRPEHQYNPIYSDNNISNDLFNTQSLEDQETTFPQRIMYSEFKTNGEYIDNWHVFKAANFIDVDSRYGEITNLLTAKDIIFYWQDTAFGKLSVNERSLVNDQNDNTIQLGQAGVLQRNDYIDTKYGMRLQDFSAISAENAVYWIDILNKAVVAYRNGVCVNYSELKLVQNAVNKFITEDTSDYRPLIHYDLQNLELICAFLKVNENHYSKYLANVVKDDAQLIFSLKLDVSTALYTRDYDHIIVFDNILFGINNVHEPWSFTKFNYIREEESLEKYLTPTILSFVVNPQPSITKVFDNQKVVTVRRNVPTRHEPEIVPSNAYDKYIIETYLANKYYTFTTDLHQSFEGTISGVETITDREGNILYPVPRYVEAFNDFELYGQRMRGKWMRVDIRNDDPAYNFAISHIITKFRQSFS